MLKLKANLLITEAEALLIERVLCDNMTGNHLLGRKRPEGYWEMRRELYEAENAEYPTERQKQINEYYKQCEDYSYWKQLPEDKKLFIETEVGKND